MAFLAAWSVAYGLPFGPIVLPVEGAGNYPAVILADAPQGYWRLDEGVGATTAADSSGKGNPLTYAGGYTLANPGAVTGDPDTSAQFNGSTAVASRTTAPVTATTNWTLEAWIYPSALNQLAAAIYNGIDDTGQGGYGFGMGSPTGGVGSNLIGFLGSAGVADSGYTFPAASRWYHIVVTRDTTTIRFYVNGAQTTSTSTKVPTTPGARFSVGAGVTSTGGVIAAFNGAIDEPAIYGTALSVGRLLAHYQEGSGTVSAFGNWVKQSPATVPAARFDAAIAYDAAHSKILMFGGNSGSAALSETWTYDGTNWTKLSPSASPSARSGAVMAYDAATSTVVLFGGYTGSKYLSDTWSWNGTTWSQLAPSLSPGTRAFASGAYDAATSTIVLFGGVSVSGHTTTYLNDTWSWNGTTWSQKSPGASPSVRDLATTAYFDATTTIVLFGGYNGTSRLNDTWTWNGTTWAQLSTSTGPTTRQAGDAGYDATTGKFMLFGGYTGSAYLNDTWAWDGSSWSAQAPAASPPIRADAGFAYDGAIGAGVLFGGTSGSALSDTYLWTTPPGPAGNVQATGGNAQATVTWAVPASTGGQSITKYTVTPFNGANALAPVTVTPPTTTATVTGLTNGTTYTFEVTATNAVGIGAGANSNSVTPATVPGAPTNPQATAGNTQATVTWTAPASNGGAAITQYTVTSSPGGVQQTTTGATTATVTGLTNGTPYTFSVTATNRVGTGAASAASNSVTPATVPGAPTNVTATAGNAQASVSWTAPSSNGGSAISGYTITPYIGATAQSPTTVGASPTSASIAGLTNGTTYTFQVAATNSAGTGLAGTSNAVTPIGPPGAPTAVTATGGNAQATVSWTAPTSNGGSAITGYTVTPYIGTTAQTPTSVGASTTSTTISSLTNGTTYTFQVTATNSAGTGPAGTSNAVTPATTPGAPATVTATAGNTSATVTWTAPSSNGGSALTGYTVTPYIGSSAQTSVNVGPSTTTATFSNLTNGTTYTFQVTASNSVGTGPPTTSNAVTPATVPGAPTNVTATAGNASAAVSWVTPTSNGGAAITTYTITPYIGTTAQAATTVNAPATSANVTGLTNGTTYTFQVTATNSAGTGPAGTSSAVTPVTVPGAPTNVTASPGNAQATVSWTAPVSNGGSAITGYIVTPYIGTTAQTATTVSATTTSTTIGSLTNGTSYTFQVAATNSAGTGATGTSNAVTPAAPPSAPQNVTASAGNTQATVNWAAPSSNGGASISNYTVTPYIGTTAQPGWTVSGTSTSFVATGLTNGTTYTFQVAAINSAGTSPVGTSNAVTPATSPSAPQNVTAITGNQQATVTWTAPASTGGSAVTSYTITPYVGGSAGVSVTTSGPTTSQVMTGLTNGTTYTFQVYASNSVGPGPAATSNAVEVGQPGAPTGVATTAGANQVTVTWTPSVTNGATISGYVVQAYVGGQTRNAIATGGGATTALFTSLQGGVAYTFQLYAQSNYGNSPSSVMSAAVTPTGSATTYASTVLTDGAGIYYRLGDPSGTVAADSSGNGNFGAYLYGPTLAASGALIGDSDPGIAVTTAQTFIPSSGGIVRLGTSAQLPTGNAARSVEIWVKTAGGAAGNIQGVVGYGSMNTRQAFQVRLIDNELLLLTNNDDKVFYAPYQIANNGWHQVVITYNGTNATAYLDGQSLGSQTFGGSLNTVVDGNGLVVGNEFYNYTGGYEQFNGSLDEAAIYPIALTASQVQTHFNLSGNARPVAPTGVSATAAANQATVSWTAPPAPSGAPLTGYVVQAFNGSQAANAIAVGPTSTSATVTGLQGGVPYTLQVSALNNFGSGPGGTSNAVTPTGALNTYASTAIGDSPSVYYRVSEVSGAVAADSSGHGNTGSYRNSPFTLGVAGALPNDTDPGVTFTQNCCQIGGFPYAGGYLQFRSGTGLPLGSAARTLEAWFKTTTVGRVIFSYGSQSTHQAFQLDMPADNQVRLVTWSDDKTFTAPYTIANGNWHHVAISYDGATTVAAYIDGQSLGTATLSAALNTVGNGNGLLVGLDAWGDGGGFWNGSLDELAVYPSALTTGQVLTHFNASGNMRPAPPASVIATTGQNQVTVSWNASTVSAGAPVTGYVVTAYAGTHAQNAVGVSGTTTTATVSGLQQGTAYTFQVAGTNNFGTGAAGSSAAVTPTGSATTYASTVLANNPSAYYRLSDPSGPVAADSSGNGRNGAYLNSPYTPGVAGAIINDSDPAVTFTQNCCQIGGFPYAGGYVQYRSGAGLPLGSAARSLEAWVKTSTTGRVIFSYGSQNTHQAFQLDMPADNEIRLVTWSDDKTFIAPYAIASGTWHHVVLTYDGATTLTAYLDGQSLGTATLSAALNTVGNGNGLLIGLDAWGDGGGFFNGTLDELAIYPSALTAAQVLANFNASGNTRPTTPGTVSATAGANQATVTWSASTASAGAPVTGYLVTAYNGTQAQNAVGVGAGATSATLSGLPSNTSYTFQVTATNNFGTSAAGTSAAVTTSGSPTTYASTVRGDGSSFYYRFGDPTGNVAADSSGNGHHAAYLNSPFTLGASGALVNDGDSGVTLTQNCCQIGGFPYLGGYVQYRSGAGLPLGSAARSVEAWFKTATVGGVIAGWGSSGTRQAFELLLASNNKLQVVTASDDHLFVTPYVITNNNWHHVVVTYDGATTIAAYLDGQSLGTAALAGTLNTTLSSNDGPGLLIGQDYVADGGGFYNGSLDEVAIYPAALSASQVSAHFNASGNTRPSAPTITSVTTGGNQANLNWSASSTSTGAPVTGYLVTAYNGAQAQDAMGVSGTTTNTTMTGLQGNVAYTFQVMATNNFGNSPASAAVGGAPTGTPSTYASTIIGGAPVVYYRLGDPSGAVAADSSGNGRNGAYLNTPLTLGSPGAVVGDSDTSVGFASNCCSIGGFPYGGGYVQTRPISGVPLGNAARTIEAWVRTTANNTQAVAGYGLPGSTRQAYQVRVVGTNQVQVVTGNDDKLITLPGSAVLNDGTWHQLVVTYDGTTLTVYADGQTAGTAIFSGALNTALDDNGLVLANDFWSIGSSQFNGSIDEVAVYGTALTLAQVQSHYTAAGYNFGTPGPPTAVTATGGTNQATVSWTPPSNSGTSAISGYTITPHVGSTIRTPTSVSGTTTSAVITNLSNGSYTFTVVATNISGNGPSSSPSAAATVTGATYAYSSTILGDGPSAYWRLGDGIGIPATDNTGNGNSGTYSGGFTIGQAGAIQGDPDTAVLFDGNTGHVAVPSSASLDMTGALSVEAWIKLATSGTTQLVVNKGDGVNANASAYELGYVPGTGAIFDTFVGNNRVRAASSSALAIGQWYHLVGTRSAAGTLLLYINGQLDGAANDGGGQINNVNAPLGIAGSGMGTGANLQPVNGTIDEVAVYPAVLTSAQVQNHWQLGGYRAGAPTAVSATGGANQATVSWTAPASTGGSPITGYVITPQLGTSPSITMRTPFFAPATPSSATVTNLSGGSSYAFTVSAITAYGVGAASTASTAVAVTGTSYPYASTVLANAPAGYWRLGEASGTLASDASGNANTATFYGGSTLGQPGAIVQDPDRGLKVDGLTGHVIVPNSSKVAQTGALSLETWVNLTSVASTQMLIDKGDGVTASLSAFDLVYIAGQGFAVDAYFGTTKASAAQSGTPATAGTWYHVVGTRTAAGALTLYVNGSQVATGTDTGGSLNNVDSPLAIGASGSGTGSQLLPLTGSLDEAAIYPSALTSGQVSADWDNGGYVPGAPTGVTAKTVTNNQATVSWSAPAYTGTSPISGYTVTPLAGGTNETPTSVDATSTSVNLTSLSSSASYAFAVTAKNASGSGAAGTSNAVTPTGATAPASGTGPGSNLGMHFEINAHNTSLPFGFFAVSNFQGQMTLGSQWTIEGWMWGFASNADTGGNSAWGLLNPANLSSVPVTGIEMRTGSSPLGSTFVWPGGSYPIPSTGYGYPDAVSPTHYALTYDGATIRGFINGSLIFSQAASGIGGLVGQPGIADQQNMATGSFDEFRVSSTARYTANFTPQTNKFATDGSTLLLWHFDDYPIAHMSNTVIYTTTPAQTGRLVSFDSSGNGNHAQLSWSGGPQITGGFPMSYDTWSLAKGMTSAEVRSLSVLPLTCPCGLYPIDSATGEFYHTFSDLSIPGRGVPLDFQRTYSSLHAATATTLGRGWTDNYNMALSVNGTTGNVTIQEESWSSVVFSPNGSGGYLPPSHVLATLVHNGDGTYTFKRTNQIQYVFDTTGKLIKEIDRNGYISALAYNGSGQLATVTEPAGRALTFAYDPTSGLLQSVTDVANRTVLFHYDATGNPDQVTDVGGGLTKFTYDPTHLMLSMKDPVCSATPSCNGVLNVYDGNGRVTQQTDDMGRVSKWIYAGYTTKFFDPKGNETDYLYRDYLLLGVTKAAGAPQQVTTSYSYDPVTLGAVAAQDPNGNSSTAGYDGNGNAQNPTDALGRTTALAYNGNNDPMSTTDPLNVATSYSYDANGNLTGSSRPDGLGHTASTSLVYDPTFPGDVITSTDANGKSWHFVHDAYGNTINNTDPLGNQTTYSYDNVGRALSSVAPKGYVAPNTPAQFTTTYTYDPFGDRLTVTDSLQHVVHYRFDANRNVTEMIDANNNPTTYTYDLDNEQTLVTRADSSTQSTGYDANGNVTSQVDGLSHTVGYGYNALDQKASMTDNLQRTTTYVYDPAGNLSGLTDPQGRVTSYRYDRSDQLVAMKYSDGVTPNVAFTYDQDGRRLTMTDGTGMSHYSYDSLHRLTQMSNGAGAAVGYGYDLAGHLTSLVYPGGTNTVTRGYDATGRLQTVTDWLAHTTTYQYDPNANLITQSYPNGVVGTFTYDNANRLTSIVDQVGTSSPFLSLNYGRDNAGQLTGENSQTYGYNSLRQLTSGGSTGYTYDQSDRLTQIALTGGNSSNLVYDVGDQLQSLTVVNQSGAQVRKYTYTYDPQGNRTSKTDDTNTTITYTYDQANRLTGYGTTATYVYNGEGLRTGKTLSGITEAFAWDLAEGVPLVIQDGTTAYVSGPGGLPLEQVLADGTVSYYHADQISSTRALTDSAGNVRATYNFDAYGNFIGMPPSASNPFQYAGQYTDSESGLMYMRARYYDAVPGRFISRDPIVASTRDAYGYALDSPLNGRDPTGLDFDPFSAFQNAVIGASQLLPSDFRQNVEAPAFQGASAVVGAGQAYLIDTQSNLEAGVFGGDLGRGAKGVLQSFGVSAAIVFSSIAVRFGLRAIVADEAAPSCTAGQMNAMRTVLAQGGKAALMKSRATFVRRIAEHEAKIAVARAAGGYTSSMEAEIANFQGQINAIDSILGGG